MGADSDAKCRKSFSQKSTISTMFRIACFFLFGWFPYVAVANSEREIEVDVVWHERQGQEQRIVWKPYRGDNWLDSVTVHRSKNYLSSAAISTLKNGLKLVFWSEDALGKTELWYSAQVSLMARDEWTEPQKVYEACRECLAPAAVVDLDGVLWLFWTDNSQGHDDVFLRRFDSGGWLDVEKVNGSNDVPDIKPVANLNRFGQVRVDWVAYSLLEQRYTEAFKLYGEKREDDVAGKIVADLSSEEIPFPNFLPYNSSPRIHVPVNRFEQTILTEQ